MHAGPMRRRISTPNPPPPWDRSSQQLEYGTLRNKERVTTQKCNFSFFGRDTAVDTCHVYIYLQQKQVSTVLQ